LFVKKKKKKKNLRRRWALRLQRSLFLLKGSVASLSADLGGGSSKYSSETLEGRSGEGFHDNSNWS